LSEELYSESTHFLLELIQNADDNSYEVPVPTLSLTYDNDGLRIDCNETSFSEKNVEAICRIGQSTKTGGGGYTGEKGIGFKSLFKVADVVWISSGKYSFKFDKNEQLGMIAPIWVEFPKDRIPGYTSFYMKLSPDYNKDELTQELRSFDSRRLLFLKRLREINLTIVERDGSKWNNRLGRTDKHEVNKTITSLEHGDTCVQYIIYRHNVDNLPSDPKRPNSSQSEILLAFPIANEGQAHQLSPQHVYNILPIRDYGFKVSAISAVAFLHAHSAPVPLAKRLFAPCKSRRNSQLVRLESCPLYSFRQCVRDGDWANRYRAFAVYLAFLSAYHVWIRFFQTS
jgi:hypothetical protein